MTVIFLGKTAFICGQAENFLHLTHNVVCGNNVMRRTVMLEGHLQRLNRSEILGKYFHLRIKCVEYLGKRVETATYQRLYGTMIAFLCDKREGQETEGFGKEHPARCKWSYGNEVKMMKCKWK